MIGTRIAVTITLAATSAVAEAATFSNAGLIWAMITGFATAAPAADEAATPAVPLPPPITLSAMISGIRHDHATVYVRENWSTVLANHGIKGTQSSLKSYALRYDDVTVALSSFGSSVSLQFHADGKVHTLRLPAAEVLIDTLTSQAE